MYSIDEIKELITTLDNSSLTNLEITCKTGEKLILKKKIKENNVPVVVANSNITPVQSTFSNDIQEKNTETPVEEKKPAGKTINCPMVGVFYAAPSPNAEPYVSVGSKVNKGDVVCIIEAMKLMNEVTATECGTIKEILVEDGSLVEFGQPLFVIE